jgi:hypothetical protein
MLAGKDWKDFQSCLYLGPAFLYFLNAIYRQLVYFVRQIVRFRHEQTKTCHFASCDKMKFKKFDSCIEKQELKVEQFWYYPNTMKIAPADVWLRPQRSQEDIPYHFKKGMVCQF